MCLGLVNTRAKRMLKESYLELPNTITVNKATVTNKKRMYIISCGKYLYVTAQLNSNYAHSTLQDDIANYHSYQGKTPLHHCQNGGLFLELEAKGCAVLLTGSRIP